jgi:hypothetical protein
LKNDKKEWLYSPWGLTPMVLGPQCVAFIQVGLWWIMTEGGGGGVMEWVVESGPSFPGLREQECSFGSLACVFKSEWQYTAAGESLIGAEHFTSMIFFPLYYKVPILQRRKPQLREIKQFVQLSNR